MATVQSTRPTGLPSLFAMVRQVRREVTKETLTSLSDDPINNVIVDALNDAVNDIFNRYKWWWSKVQGFIKLSGGQTDYALPTDFMRMASEPEIGSRKLREVDAEEWTYYTGNSNLSSPNTVLGAPTTFMVDRGFIRFYPGPSSDFIASIPTIGVFYYQRPSPRLVLALDSAAAFNLPVQFQEALVRFAVAKLKILLHYDDFNIDMARFEFLVQQQIQNDTVSVHPSRFRPRNRYSANFG